MFGFSGHLREKQYTSGTNTSLTGLRSPVIENHSEEQDERPPASRKFSGKLFHEIFSIPYDELYELLPKAFELYL
ncbi:hypothetical protein AVEN_6483-1 [Araneus ventricosus]|uniref:Uncharacterized protein n=1 Tax=Araneus ventricosus TaxID=182803 RepID=A0A4Y2H741_ARAVE|nr:hypothetical protein AVEN_6483-1 [Araneus ventricosus]